MLAPIRQAVGLGNPPEPFYTNEIESINCVIKCKVTRELIIDQQNAFMSCLSQVLLRIQKRNRVNGKHLISPQLKQ